MQALCLFAAGAGMTLAAACRFYGLVPASLLMGIAAALAADQVGGDAGSAILRVVATLQVSYLLVCFLRAAIRRRDPRLGGPTGWRAGDRARDR